jgi:zinc transport system permease protein
MPWPFDREYMQLALAAGLVVGACAPLIGVFLVQRRLSLMGDGIGHIAFAGVGIGAVTGIWPVWTALGAAVLASLAIERLRSRGTAQGDVALALFFYGGIALGVVLISASHELSTGIVSYLFGQILTVERSEVLLVLALGVVIVSTVLVCGRALFAMAVDEEWARVAGLPVTLLNNVLAVLTAITVVVAMRVVGILLVAALMVGPVGAAQILARSQKAILTWSVGVGIGSVVLGLGIARAEGLAPGGTIVLVAVALFAVLATGQRVVAR